MITWFLVVSADVILVLEIASLFGVLNQPIILTLIQGILVIATMLLNRRYRIGFPQFKNFHIQNKIQTFFQLIKTHRWLFVFTFIVGLNYALLAICILLFPQNITDNLYNQLSRIGYWIQQGSLKHYVGFATVGMIYPYNNSLLISLPMILLKTGIFAGFVQFFAAFICALSVYLISNKSGSEKKTSLIAGLIILTYPIIIYESITGQSDLLVAAFIAAAFALLVSYIKKNQKIFLYLSLLGMALALGTNQLAFIILPAFCALFIYGAVITKKFKVKFYFESILCFIILFLLVGSYDYLQNIVTLGGPFGPKGFVEDSTHISQLSDIPPRIYINSSRLFGQFISCDGLPPGVSNFCLNAKDKFLTPVLAKGITSNQFLFGTTPYDLSRPNPYNAESVWYGPLSWILILPSIIFGLYYSIRKRMFLNLILLIAPLSYFVFIQITIFGWNPYQGRYLITAVVLFQPLTSWMFESKRIVGKVVTGLLCIIGLFIMVYSTLNNYSLPLTSKNSLAQIEKWGKEHSVLVQKIAYKVRPFIMSDRDVWSMNQITIMTISNSQYEAPVTMVEKFVPLDGSLGIMSDFTEFPDYNFRGDQVRRSLVRIINPVPDLNKNQVSFILLAPEYEKRTLPGFNEIARSNHWVLFAHN